MIELTQARLKQFVVYCPKSGKMHWKMNINPKVIGKEVGSLDSYGYRGCRIDSKNYRLHRLAFLYMTGVFPSEEIDHINRIRDDNRWVNLRLATRSENQHNSALPSNNTTGVKGLCRLNSERQNPRFQANVTALGKTYSKSFPFPRDKPTEEDRAKSLAIAWLEKTREIVCGDFTNHG